MRPADHITGAYTAGEASFDRVVLEHLRTCPGATDHDAKGEDHMERLRYLVLCLNGEAGEAANFAKKEWRGDQNIRADCEAWEAKLEEEIVDAANYVCMLAAHMDIDLKDRQLIKFQQVEARPDWDVWSKRSNAGNMTELHQRDDIHIEYNYCTVKAHVSLNPLGSVSERVKQAVARVEELHEGAKVQSYRTSKETIETLLHIGGVIESRPAVVLDEGFRRFFLDERIRAWGDYA